VARRHLTVKKLRNIMKDDVQISKESLEIEDRSKTQAIDKSISVLKMARVG
jgi:hypothetical protein